GELIPSSCTAPRFIESLADAYDDVGGRGAKQVPILDVYRSLVILSQTSRFWRDARGSNFSGLSADQFRARLSKTLEAGITRAPDGRELRLLPPLNPRDALFIFQPSEGRFGYVGRLEFVHVGSGEA